jgi:hypothetical protein
VTAPLSRQQSPQPLSVPRQQQSLLSAPITPPPKPEAPSGMLGSHITQSRLSQ